MAEPEERFTLAGTKLPPREGLPPTLLYHRWQRYDCFWPDHFIDDKNKKQNLKPFKRDFTALRFLQRVATEIQESNREPYKTWHGRFSNAFAELEIEPVIRATTLWRLVVGWGTNPAFETGITLDHLLGFPFIPGSAVKGLLHRVAEQELLEPLGNEPAIPIPPPELPESPPSELQKSLARALRVRALFGSIHLRKRKKPSTDPESPFDRLRQWKQRLPEPGSESDPWNDVRKQLARLCSETPAGGMVTCFDAVPDKQAFSAKRLVLEADVLTPHPHAPKDKGPNPILFLAVRDGVTFELRYRLTWPAAELRDEEERERIADLGSGIDRKTIAAELKRWLERGLEELGLGGKTSAGYGYLLAEGIQLPSPELREEPLVETKPAEDLTEAERHARAVLPDGIDSKRAVNILDKALNDPDPARRAAVVHRYICLFPNDLGEWRTRKSPAMRRRVEAMDRILGRSQVGDER